MNVDRAPSTFGEQFFLTAVAHCLNTREILFGVHPGRRVVVRRIAAASGVPRMADLARLVERWFDDMNEADTPTLGWDRRSTQGALKPLGWVGLTGLRNRLSDCYRSRAFT